MVPVLYVKSASAAQRFYGHFGFTVDRCGEAGDARWVYLRSGAHTVLLTEVHPPLVTVELPLALYVYVDDVEALGRRLEEAGVGVELAGYPGHAPGGEIRVVDPDGNVVLAGQRTAVPEERRRPQTGPSARFTLIKAAAEEAARRGGAPQRCQIGRVDGQPCLSAAEVKLADPWGDTVWGCTPHVEEALITAPAAFIATHDEGGLGHFLRRRAAPEAESAAGASG